MKNTFADQHVVVGSSGDVQCFLSTSKCELRQANHLADELLATLPEGFCRWSMQHLATVMLEDSAWPQEFRPALMALGWGRAWRQGETRITRITGLLLEGPIGLQSWGRSLIVCTRQGAIARSLVQPESPEGRFRHPRPHDEDDFEQRGRQGCAACFVPHASRLASAVHAALEPVLGVND